MFATRRQVARSALQCLVICANMSKYGYTTFFFPNYHELPATGWLLASQRRLFAASKTGHGLSLCGCVSPPCSPHRCIADKHRLSQTVTRKTRLSRESPYVAGSADTASCIKAGQSEVRAISSYLNGARHLTLSLSGSIRGTVTVLRSIHFIRAASVCSAA